MGESTPFLSSNDLTPDTESLGFSKEACDPMEKNKDTGRHRFRNDNLLLLMAVIILLLTIVIIYDRTAIPGTNRGDNLPYSLGTGVDSAINEVQWVPVRFVSNYSSKGVAGMEQVDDNWDAITSTHGIVAVDHQWAASKGLPVSTSLERDPNKGVYTLEAYHSIHCLTIIRQTLFSLARGQPLEAPFGHSTHCLAGLLQHIMCNADDTLLYHKEHLSDGDGQMRKCRNWKALSSWAGKNSACYVDDTAGVAHEDQANCKKSGDGLLAMQ
ncbi:MAG: hypothetical protein M1821_004545 [Bathelium mastoideum]|nr:MAG: hypothetical protein M1821_004545 [Bathelium mastoideum]